MRAAPPGVLAVHDPRYIRMHLLRDIERPARCFQLVHAIPPGALRLTGRIKPRTTRPIRSALVARASPLLRTGPPARPATVLGPLRFRRSVNSPPDGPRKGTGQYQERLLLFHAEAADRARVIYRPDTAWPVSGYPPGSSRGRRNTPVSMSSKSLFGNPMRPVEEPVALLAARAWCRAAGAPAAVS